MHISTRSSTHEKVLVVEQVLKISHLSHIWASVTSAMFVPIVDIHIHRSEAASGSGRPRVTQYGRTDSPPTFLLHHSCRRSHSSPHLVRTTNTEEAYVRNPAAHASLFVVGRRRQAYGQGRSKYSCRLSHLYYLSYVVSALAADAFDSGKTVLHSYLTSQLFVTQKASIKNRKTWQPKPKQKPHQQRRPSTSSTTQPTRSTTP